MKINGGWFVVLCCNFDLNIFIYTYVTTDRLTNKNVLTNGEKFCLGYTSEKTVKNGVTSAKYFTYALTGQLVWESNGSLAKSYSYAKDNLGKIYSDVYFSKKDVLNVLKKMKRF